MPVDIPFRQRLTCTVSEACSATGLAKTTMFGLIATQQIKSKMVAGRRLISVESLISLLEPSEKAA
ncbi:MAG: hypothetical protein WA417_01235 [Stellaceae bacterium]